MNASNYQGSDTKVSKRIDLLADVLAFIESTVDRPVLRHFPQGVAFRFREPSPLHFCILQGARMVSGLRSAMLLAEAGFNQEVCILARTILENSLKMHLVSALGKASSATAEKLVADYFGDSTREGGRRGRNNSLRQHEVHEDLGKEMFEELERNPEALGDLQMVPASKLAEIMSYVYWVYSNYVHSRYPESMDMYGGSPARIHLNSMKGTPKEDESHAVIESMVTECETTLKLVFIRFGLARRGPPPEIVTWVFGTAMKAQLLRDV